MDHLDPIPAEPIAGAVTPAPGDAVVAAEPPGADAVPQDVEAAPAVADAASSPGRRRRWIVAGGVVAAVVLGTIALVIALGTKPLPAAVQYLPGDSAIVFELRPELPGDQRQHLGNLLAHFPGFEDQSTLTQKLDEVLARIVDEASGGTVDYLSRIKPILAGPLAAGLSRDAFEHIADVDTQPRGLIVGTTDGTASCDSVLGPTSPLETHRGVELRSSSGGFACAIDGRHLLLGDTASVMAGIDAQLDHAGIDTSATFGAARKRIAGDQLALLYVNGSAIVEGMSKLVPILGAATVVASRVPEWVIIGLRVVDDAVQVEMQAAPVEAPALAADLPTIPPPAPGTFAEILPADAFGFVEAHGIGAGIERLIAQLKADPSQAAAIDQLEQALVVVGGADNIIAWIQDFGFAGLPLGDSAGGVVLVRGTDAGATAGRLAQVRNLLVLASTGTDITVRDSEHAGTAITTVDLGDLGTMLNGLGLGLDSSPVAPGVRLSFSLAAREDILMVGIGDGAIERLLDVDAAASLATSALYRRGLELTGGPIDAAGFAALDAIIARLIQLATSGAGGDAWTRDVKPYIEHLAAISASTTTTAAGTRARFVLIVK